MKKKYIFSPLGSTLVQQNTPLTRGKQLTINWTEKLPVNFAGQQHKIFTQEQNAVQPVRTQPVSLRLHNETRSAKETFHTGAGCWRAEVLLDYREEGITHWPLCPHSSFLTLPVPVNNILSIEKLPKIKLIFNLLREAIF